VAELLVDALWLGVGATAFMDVVALAQRRVLGIPSLDYALVGRWLGHLAGGTVVHRPISGSAPIRAEAALGWTFHYLTGVVFALVFLVLVGSDWQQRPAFVSALVFGVVTVLAPFLVLQPGLGAGIAARRTPRPNIARLRSLTAHASFGIGLWVSGLGGMLAF
jgi:hypothetical protein